MVVTNKKIHKVKSISEIYSEVSSCDLVITNDAPLNTALNKCLNRSVFGNFAMTSKMISGKFCEKYFEEKVLEDLDIVLKVVNNSNFKYSLKEVLFYFNEISLVFRYVSDLDKVSEYLSRDGVKIFKFISTLPVKEFLDYSKFISDSSYYSGKDVCVVGSDGFYEFDKKVLLGSEKKVDVFCDDSFELDKVYLFDSKRSIVERVCSMIDKDNCNDVAIVLDVSSDYLPVLKAKLINLGIPINEKLEISYEFRTREFLSVLDLVFGRFNSKVSDVLGIANIFGFELDSSKSSFDFLKVAQVSEDFKLFNSFLNEVEVGTFGELFDRFITIGVDLPLELKDLLYSLNLFDVKVSNSGLLNLKFCIENFSVSISDERKREGVLLVDCKNSSFIDRDIIFYVGMDSGWTKQISSADYVDYDVEFARDLDSFSILLQQGMERFIFSTEFSGVDKTIPPFYFNFLYNEDVNSYVGGFFDYYRVSNLGKKLVGSNLGLVSEDLGLKKELEAGDDSNSYDRKTLSSSSLNSFVKCPKMYSYSKLDFGADKEVFMKGNLIHSFAQFYVEYKDFVLKTGISKFTDIIIGELSLMSNKYQLKVLKNNVNFCLMSIMEFVDGLNIGSVDFLEGSSKRYENIFADKFSKKLSFKGSEYGFRDSDLKIKGFIDLVVSSVLIVDYKTSASKKSVGEIIKNSNLSDLTSRCDFQPLVYFSIFRKLSSERDLRFMYSFPMINSYARVVGSELDDEKVYVNYLGCDFIEYLFLPEFFELFYEMSPKYSKAIMDFMKDFSWFDGKVGLSDFELSSSDFVSKFSDDLTLFLVSGGMKDTKTNLGNVPKFLKSVYDFRNGTIYKQSEVYLFKDDVDKFEKFLKKSLKELNVSNNSRYEYKPAEGEKTCNDCDFKAICLKKFDSSVVGGNKK